MPFYDDRIIEEVQAASNIVDVVRPYVQLRKKGSTYFGLCPFHSEKTGSFSVSETKQIYHCFGCGAGGNVFRFLMQAENFTFGEAVEYLAEKAGITLPKQSMSDKARKEADKRTRIIELNKDAATYFYMALRSKEGEKGLEYFKNRGLSEETMRSFGLGYSKPYSNDLYQYFKKKGVSDDLLKESGLCSFDEKRGGYDKFWNRVMFPIMDKNNHVIGFGGRVMGDGEPKYLNSQETLVFEKSKNLYGLNIAKSTKKPYMLLCEGYMDVISLHQAGFTNAVASLGTALTVGHAKLLKKYTSEVYITYDSDGAGVKAALRAIPILREEKINVKVINMKPYKDPDEFIKNLGAEEYERRIENAENGFMFEVRMLEANYDMSDPAKKTQFDQEVARKLLAFVDELERNNYADAVTRAFNIDKESLNKSLIRMSDQIDRTSTKQPEPLKSGINNKKNKEDGRKISQKVLLSYMIEHKELYQKIKGLIEPDDFTEPLYYKVAVLVFKGLEEGNLNPPMIINLFEQEEEEREVAALFSATIDNLETKDERIKAIRDTLVKVKKNSIDCKLSNNSIEIQDAMKIAAENKRIMGLLQNINLDIELE